MLGDIGGVKDLLFDLLVLILTGFEFMQYVYTGFLASTMTMTGPEDQGGARVDKGSPARPSCPKASASCSAT